MPHKSLSPHDLALRAIAAIALTVPACSSSSTGSLSSTADASATQDAAAGASDTAAADVAAGASDAAQQTDTAVATDTAQASDAEQPNDVAAQTDTAQAIDTAQATDTVNAADAAQEVADGKPLCVATPNDGQCCLHLGEWCLQQFPDVADYEARAQCQFGPNYDASTGCSPWGPPAPPAFAPAAWGLA